MSFKLTKSLFSVKYQPTYHFYNDQATKRHMVMGFILANFVPKYEDLRGLGPIKDISIAKTK